VPALRERVSTTDSRKQVKDRARGGEPEGDADLAEDGANAAVGNCLDLARLGLRRRLGRGRMSRASHPRRRVARREGLGARLVDGIPVRDRAVTSSVSTELVIMLCCSSGLGSHSMTREK